MIHEFADQPGRCRVLKLLQHIWRDWRAEESMCVTQPIEQRPLEAQLASPQPQSSPESRLLTVVAKQIMDIDQIAQSQTLISVALEE